MARILVADDDNRVRAAITKDLVAAATVLPRLGGRHPAEALRRDAQPVPVLFHQRLLVQRRGRKPRVRPGTAVPAQAWTLTDLLTRVREALDAGPELSAGESGPPPGVNARAGTPGGHSRAGRGEGSVTRGWFRSPGRAEARGVR
jgi:hypothetical protein